MAIAYVSDTQGQNDAASSITVAHTVASGSDRLLVGKAHGECNATPANLTVTGITFNGDALTFIDSEDSPGAEKDRVEMWYMVAPDEGTFNLVVNFTGALDGCYVSSENYTGIAQTSTLNTSGSASAISTGPLSVSITTTEDDCLIVDAAQTTSSTRTIAATAGQTELYNEANAGQFKAGGSYEIVGVAGTYTQTWSTSSSSDWMIVAAAFKPATGVVSSVKDFIGGGFIPFAR